MTKQVGAVLTAVAPIAQVAAAVHKAVQQKPTWKERKIKYALILGIGEYWSNARIGPSDPRRLDGNNPAPMYDIVDMQLGGSAIHVAYRDEEGGSQAAFVGIGFDPPNAGNLYSVKLAQRAADFLAEVGVQALVEKLKV